MLIGGQRFVQFHSASCIRPIRCLSASSYCHSSLADVLNTKIAMSMSMSTKIAILASALLTSAKTGGRATSVGAVRISRNQAYRYRMSSTSWVPQNDENEDGQSGIIRQPLTPTHITQCPRSKSNRRPSHFISRGFQDVRWFSSDGDSQKYSRHVKSDLTNDKATTPLVSTPSIEGTDSAFASYLSGEAVPVSLGNNLGLDQLSPAAVLKQRRALATKRSRTMALNIDKELYKQIIDNQATKKEESRRKTAANVYRALIGNVVICSGTFLIPRRC